MKILVATSETQGQRESDFSFTKEGEAVCFDLICSRGMSEDIDGGCGCQRSMIGISTRKGTTTVKVVSRQITRTDYIKALAKSEALAWNKSETDEGLLADIRQQADRLIDIASGFDIGDVLEFRRDRVEKRQGASA